MFTIRGGIRPTIWVGGVSLIVVVYLLIMNFVTIATPPSSAKGKMILMLKSISAQLDVFRLDCGRYPTAEEGLTALLARPEDPKLAEKWLGPYLKGDGTPVVMDAWGHKLGYEVTKSGAGYRVWSFGWDGMSGTEDDLAVSKP